MSILFKKQSVKLTFNALVVLGLMFVSWNFVSAEVIVSQVNNNVNETVANTYIYQELGNVFNGEAVGFVKLFQSGTGPARVAIVDCGLSQCTNTHSYIDFSNQIESSCVLTFFGQICDYDFSSLNVVLTSGHYFALITSNTGGGNNTQFGDADDIYPDGDCIKYSSGYTPCTIIKDMYFQIYDKNGFHLNTKIISVSPYDNQEIPSYATGIDLGYIVYIQDGGPDQIITFDVSPYNNYQDYAGGSFIILYSTTTSMKGLISYSTTTSMIHDLGNYSLNVTIKPSSGFGFLLDGFTPATVATSTWFYFGTTTAFGENIRKGTQEYARFFNSFSVTNTATSTLSSACDFMSAFSAHLPDWIGGNGENTWDFGDCIYSLFVPSNKQAIDLLNTARSGFLSYFPLGYVTDFFTILAGTTTASSIGIDATVPPGIPGEGSNLTVSIDENTLSYIWDADIGSFVNESAPDTRSFYDITYDYWKIICYILLAFYLIGRILGSTVIPGFSVTNEIRGRNIRTRKLERMYESTITSKIK